MHPGAIVDAVELDPEAVRLGDRFFGSRRAPGKVFTALDGRVFVDRATEQWHVIHVDAYGHQVYIPAHLASVEFFRAAFQRLLPGGVIACNVGGLDERDPVLRAIAATMANVFGQALAFHVPDSRNLLLLARRDRLVDPTVLAKVQLGEERLEASDRSIWQGLLARAASTAAWHSFASGGSSLVDDCPELDRLLHQSYVASGDNQVLTTMAGDQRARSAHHVGRPMICDDAPMQARHAAISVQPTATTRDHPVVSRSPGNRPGSNSTSSSPVDRLQIGRAHV